jgi:hypothetical protein
MIDIKREPLIFLEQTWGLLSIDYAISNISWLPWTCGKFSFVRMEAYMEKGHDMFHLSLMLFLMSLVNFTCQIGSPYLALIVLH